MEETVIAEAGTTVKTLIRLLVALASVTLVVWAHRTVSWGSLGLMLIGLAGVLIVLYLYNRDHR